MEKEKLKSISDNLERITGCPLILHNQSETMAIKRTIYSYIYNQKRLGMLYYDVFDAEMEIEDRLNNQENDEILSGLFDIIYNILNKEIDENIDIDIELITYLISDKEIQTALEDDIPNIIKLNRIYEKMEKDNIALECLKLEELDYMLDFVDEVDLLELSIDEFFILFNNKIKEFMEQNEEIKKYLIVE